MKKRIITLTTDFGLSDWYAGVMKGVILSINPHAEVVDITHLVPAGGIRKGALALKSACGFFPKGTVHVGVVDPGVGGKRRPILIKTKDYFFIGPDNGLLLPAALSNNIKKAVELENKKYFLDAISPTFHGRDIFAPVAAHLSMGKGISWFGRAIDPFGLKTTAMPRVKAGKDSVEGTIVYVDSFGNLITDIERDDVKWAWPLTDIEIGRRIIKGIKAAYCDAEEGGLVALFGSSGNLEIAVNRGDAGKRLNIGAGERVCLRKRPGQE